MSADAGRDPDLVKAWREGRSRWWTLSLLVILLAAATYQLTVDWSTYGRPWSRRVLASWSEPVWYRSILYQHWVGEEERAFIAFAREAIPSDSRVMIPAREVHFVFGHRRMMQQFLLPRRIVQCDPDSMGGVEGCFRRAAAEDLYVVMVDPFWLEEPPEAGFVERAFADGISVLEPALD